MQRKTRKPLLAVSGALFALVLAACSNIVPPQQVGDPLALDGAAISFGDPLWISETPQVAGLNPAQITDWLPYLTWDDEALGLLMAGNGILASAFEHYTEHSGPPVAVNTAMSLAAKKFLLAQLINPNGGNSPSLPADATNSQLAMGHILGLLEEFGDELEFDELRLEMELERNAQRLANIREAIERYGDEGWWESDHDTAFELPMPFVVEERPAGEESPIPNFVLGAVSSFSQPVGLANLTVTIPEEVTDFDNYPESITVHGYSITITAARRTGSSFEPVLTYRQSGAVESGLVFNHTGGGNYELASGNGELAQIRVGSSIEGLLKAINDGAEVNGSVDIALVTTPAFGPAFSVDFDFWAGEGEIRFF